MHERRYRCSQFLPALLVLAALTLFRQLLLVLHTQRTNSSGAASQPQPSAWSSCAFLTASQLRRGIPGERGSPHFTTLSRFEHTCSSAGDARLNCTLCLPGWRGSQCDKAARVTPCSLFSCLDWSRCPPGAPLTVHVYDTPASCTASWIDSKTSAEYRSVTAALRASNRHVASARDACLLVPWFDTLCNGNRCADTWTEAPKLDVLSRTLEQLPQWRKTGANHLVFDMSSSHAPTLPIGRGIYLATSFWAAGKSFRHGHDQALPLWNQRWADERQAQRAQRVRSARQHSAPPLLLSFKGQRMHFCTSELCAPDDIAEAALAGRMRGKDAYTTDWVRNQLRKLHDGHDIVIATRCVRELEDAQHCDAHCQAECAADMQLYDAVDYDQLLINSSFALVVPGITPNSYRLVEALSYGVVPVIASDFMVLPYKKLLNWRAFSLQIGESELLRLPEVLRSLSQATVRNMQQSAIAAYERCFKTPGAIALCAVAELELQMSF